MDLLEDCARRQHTISCASTTAWSMAHTLVDVRRVRLLSGLLALLLVVAGGGACRGGFLARCSLLGSLSLGGLDRCLSITRQSTSQ